MMQIRKGVLMVEVPDKESLEPVYFIEHVLDSEEGNSYVLVYKVKVSKSASGPVYEKEYYLVDPPQPVQRRMSDYTKTLIKWIPKQTEANIQDTIRNSFKKKKKIKKERGPLFVTDVVEGSIGKGIGYSSGFYDHSPDTYLKTEGGNIYQPGEPTGAFIPMSQIKWLGDYVATEDIIMELKALRALKDASDEHGYVFIR